MIKIQELKQGDIVRVVQDTTEREGTVVSVSREENMVCVDNGVQEFWYTPEQIAAIHSITYLADKHSSVLKDIAVKGLSDIKDWSTDIP